MAGRVYLPWGERLGIGLKSECEAVAQACVSVFGVKDGRGMEGWALGQWTSLQLRGFVPATRRLASFCWIGGVLFSASGVPLNRDSRVEL